jgi:SHS family lactate transporter-like MFS transporter
MMIATFCSLLVVPFWVSAHNMVMIVVGVFLMQFFVQGAWGVVPAHINELSPGQYRGFFPGFAYQLGILCAASIPYVESVLGERFTYTQAMGGMMVVVFLLALVVMYLGPEARGVSFRKAVMGAVPE